ncbi:MAG: hypothetical protein DDT26_02055 [Dehalococcoidia bacterium]|nr:hypothetical protein [Chloroflexota bacterium]
MKQVIGGKRYDTETATEIANASYSGGGDFRAWKETLYRAQKGAYFLAGSGGPMTKYAVSVGQGTTSGSSQITPLTEAEAFDWCQEHDCIQAIDAHFGHLVEEA